MSAIGLTLGESISNKVGGGGGGEVGLAAANTYLPSTND